VQTKAKDSARFRNSALLGELTLLRLVKYSLQALLYLQESPPLIHGWHTKQPIKMKIIVPLQEDAMTIAGYRLEPGVDHMLQHVIHTVRLPQLHNALHGETMQATQPIARTLLFVVTVHRVMNRPSHHPCPWSHLMVLLLPLPS
jgi:hypothetical protein